MESSHGVLLAIYRDPDAHVIIKRCHVDYVVKLARGPVTVDLRLSPDPCLLPDTGM
jgi:hypothetical protein